MFVRDAKPGQTIETLTRDRQATGRVYKIGAQTATHAIAWRNYRQGRARVPHLVRCVLLADVGRQCGEF